jgi:hypothetical protein
MADRWMAQANTVLSYRADYRRRGVRSRPRLNRCALWDLDYLRVTGGVIAVPRGYGVIWMLQVFEIDLTPEGFEPSSVRNAEWMAVPTNAVLDGISIFAAA